MAGEGEEGERYATHIVRAVRVRLTSGPSISLRQLVWTDVCLNLI